MLRASHLPFSISSSERDQWLLCLNQALSEVVGDAALRKELSDAFAQGGGSHAQPARLSYGPASGSAHCQNDFPQYVAFFDDAVGLCRIF